MTDLPKQHRHCQICGKPIPVTESFCSEECINRYKVMMKRRKLLVYIMYALIGIILIVILMSNSF